MDPQLRLRAETRLQETADQLGLADPRQPYRDRLKQLREQHPNAFAQAIEHYESRVLPRLAEAGDPMAVWLEYGVFLAGLTADGRAWRVDGSGRASSLETPPEALRAGDLVIFVPEDTATEVLVMAQPRTLSAAQHATIELLVKRKLSLS